MAALDIDQAIEQFQQAGNAFHTSNPEPMLQMFSRREDVSVANPWSPAVRGWSNVEATVRRAGLNYREGEPVAYETIAKVVTPGVAFFVENEHSRAKVGGSQEFSRVALRATVIFRKEAEDRSTVTGFWDFAKQVVYSNVTLPDNTFLNLKGSLKRIA